VRGGLVGRVGGGGGGGVGGGSSLVVGPQGFMELQRGSRKREKLILWRI